MKPWSDGQAGPWVSSQSVLLWLSFMPCDDINWSLCISSFLLLMWIPICKLMDALMTSHNPPLLITMYSWFPTYEAVSLPIIQTKVTSVILLSWQLSLPRVLFLWQCLALAVWSIVGWKLDSTLSYKEVTAVLISSWWSLQLPGCSSLSFKCISSSLTQGWVDTQGSQVRTVHSGSVLIWSNNLLLTLFHPQVAISRHRVIARFGLMHMIGTNLCIWLNVLVQETKHEIINLYFHGEHHGGEAQHNSCLPAFCTGNNIG